ncbi:MAG: STAS domain-containing protein [Candidatus Cyclobacteriaceae bacterium M2_1C_046]
MTKGKKDQEIAFSDRKLGFDSPMVVSEITDQCLYTGFYGRMDSARLKGITERILDTVEKSDNNLIIVDLSNVEYIDSAVAANLYKLGDTLQLIGVKTLFCGIGSEVAQSMTNMGIEFKKYETYRRLKDALKRVYAIQGLQLISLDKG